MSINGSDSVLSAISYIAAKGFILKLPFFLLQINSWNQVKSLCKVCQFPDLRNLLRLSNTIKKLTETFNFDLRHLVNCLTNKSFKINKKEMKKVENCNKVTLLNMDKAFIISLINNGNNTI